MTSLSAPFIHLEENTQIEGKGGSHSIQVTLLNLSQRPKRTLLGNLDVLEALWMMGQI